MKTHMETRSARRPDGFTLMEMLVVISIIAILMAILLPALAAARNQAYGASTLSELHDIANGCESYYQDYDAYPGPLAENIVSQNSTTVTGTQNLLWGLDGLWSPTASAPYPDNGTTMTSVTATGAANNAIYVSTTVGNGQFDYSKSLTAPNGTLTYQQNNAFWVGKGQQIGQVNGTALVGAAATLPTICDTYPTALPILYFRKVPGVDAVPVQTSATTGLAAYYQNCNAGYTDSTLPMYETGQDTAGSVQATASPYTTQTTFPYLASVVVNPNTIPSTATNADAGPYPTQGGFVLISAGSDRIYGGATSSDDIIVFGGQ